MSVFAQVGKNAGLVALFLEPFQRPLEIVVVVENDFGHARSPRSKRWGQSECKGRRRFYVANRKAVKKKMNVILMVAKQPEDPLLLHTRANGPCEKA